MEETMEMMENTTMESEPVMDDVDTCEDNSGANVDPKAVLAVGGLAVVGAAVVIKKVVTKVAPLAMKGIAKVKSKFHKDEVVEAESEVSED